MAILELFMVGLATAFMRCSQLPTAKPTSYDNINTVVVAGNVFLAHRQSIGAFFDSIGAEATKPAKSAAMASLTFDEEVEKLLDHGW